MQKRGQVSVEATILLVIFLIIIAIILVRSFENISSSQSYADNYAARESLADLGQAAKRIYLGGNTSFEQVSITVPSRINNSVINTTVIGFLNDGAGSLSQTYLHDTQVPVAGSLPTSSGSYLINVSSNGSHVIFNFTS